MSDKAWSGRFSEPVSDLVKRYTASVFFDQRMAAQDIRGSLAHARMLARQNIISGDDLAAIERGMAQIAGEIETGRFNWNLDDEDVHLNIEKRLTALIGDAGKRLHTGRSRNDQVATDIRLWLRDTIDAIDSLLADLMRALLDVAAQHVATPLPGFTHLQVAQPVTFGHHLLAYVEMLSRDRARFTDCRKRVNRLPLGAAALAGTTFPIDRAFVAQELGFDGVCENSLDAVSDRDFAIEFCAAASLVMVHISRFSEELILWMSPRVGFIDLADRFCTGSSIMPQKKNPDVPELARGKTGRVFGHLMGLLTLMKGQPLAYNKDNQEDKEPLFDTADTLVDTLRIFTDMASGIQVKATAMAAALKQGFATATDLADYLVKKGLPFRDAHEAVARAVRAAEQQGCDLADLSLDALRAFSPLIEPDIFAVLTVDGSLAARDHIGGTAPTRSWPRSLACAPRCNSRMETIGGKYEIFRPLGQGTTASVYLCFDPFTEREVAVKRIYPEILKDVKRGKQFRHLLMNEASLAGKLIAPAHRADLRCGDRRGRKSTSSWSTCPAARLEPYCVPEQPVAGRARRRNHLQVHARAGVSRTASALPIVTSSRRTSCSPRCPGRADFRTVKSRFPILAPASRRAMNKPRPRSRASARRRSCHPSNCARKHLTTRPTSTRSAW